MPDCAAFLRGLKAEGIGFRIRYIKTATFQFTRQENAP